MKVRGGNVSSRRKTTVDEPTTTTSRFACSSSLPGAWRSTATTTIADSRASLRTRKVYHWTTSACNKRYTLWETTFARRRRDSDNARARARATMRVLLKKGGGSNASPTRQVKRSNNDSLPTCARARARVFGDYHGITVAPRRPESSSERPPLSPSLPPAAPAPPPPPHDQPRGRD